MFFNFKSPQGNPMYSLIFLIFSVGRTALYETANFFIAEILKPLTFNAMQPKS